MKSIHSCGSNRALANESSTHNRHSDFASLINYFWNYPDLPSNSENTVSAMEWEPKMQITETKDAVNITAELPGISEDDLDLQISSDGYLSLSGEKKDTSERQEKNAYFSEISYGAFKRTIPLPWDLDYERVNAEFDNGILTVSIPKSQNEKQKFKKISVSRHQQEKQEKPIGSPQN